VTALRALPPVPAPEVVNGTVEGWHDGDTVNVWVHRGGSDYSRWAVRLLGGACRELADPGGPEAYTHLAGLVPTGTPVVLVDVRDDKYGGRKLARVVVDLGRGSVDLVELLIADGWAAPWNGRGTQPRPAWPRVEVLAA
jgi:endonuclease YncB( thermonuclease family)